MIIKATLSDLTGLLNADNLAWISEDTRPDAQDILMDMADLFQAADIKTVAGERSCKKAIGALSLFLGKVPKLPISGEGRALLLLSALRCVESLFENQPEFYEATRGLWSKKSFDSYLWISGEHKPAVLALRQKISWSSREIVARLKESGEAAFAADDDSSFFTQSIQKPYAALQKANPTPEEMQPLADLMVRFAQDGISRKDVLRVHYATRVMAKMIADGLVPPSCFGDAVSESAITQYHQTLPELKQHISTDKNLHIGPKALLLALQKKGLYLGRLFSCQQNDFNKEILNHSLNALVDLELGSLDASILYGPFRLVQRAINLCAKENIDRQTPELRMLAWQLEFLALEGCARKSVNLSHYALSCTASMLKHELITPSDCPQVASEAVLHEARQPSYKMYGLALYKGHQYDLSCEVADESLLTPALNALIGLEQGPQDSQTLRGPFKLVQRAINVCVNEGKGRQIPELLSLVRQLEFLALEGVAGRSPYLSHYALSCVASLLTRDLIFPAHCPKITTQAFLNEALLQTNKMLGLQALADGKKFGQFAFVEALADKGISLDISRKNTFFRPQKAATEALTIRCGRLAQAALTSEAKGLYAPLCSAVEEMAELLVSPQRPPVAYFGRAISEPFLIKLAQKLPTLRDAGVLAEGFESGPQALFSALAKREALPRAVTPLIDDYHTWLRQRQRSPQGKAF